jgi:uncharacterized protein YacL (UPF0231 family)
MIDQTSILRVIGCSIEHSIVSNWIDHLIVSRSVTLMHLDRLIEIITINQTNDQSIDLIMIDQTNAIRAIGCSIEHSIVSNWINNLIVLRSIKLIHLDRSVKIITINMTNDRSILILS